MLPYKVKRARPYLYSDQEIQNLLRAALKLSNNGGLRSWTYDRLFGLLSVTGLRLSEAKNLELQDVDLQAGVLTIRGVDLGDVGALYGIAPLDPHDGVPVENWHARAPSTAWCVNPSRTRSGAVAAMVARLAADRGPGCAAASTSATTFTPARIRSAAAGRLSGPLPPSRNH